MFQQFAIFAAILEASEQGSKAHISHFDQDCSIFQTPIYYTCVRVTRERIFVSANSSQSYGHDA